MGDGRDRLPCFLSLAHKVDKEAISRDPRQAAKEWAIAVPNAFPHTYSEAAELIMQALICEAQKSFHLAKSEWETEAWEEDLKNARRQALLDAADKCKANADGMVIKMFCSVEEAAEQRGRLEAYEHCEKAIRAMAEEGGE